MGGMVRASLQRLPPWADFRRSCGLRCRMDGDSKVQRRMAWT